jgi:uncharacterized protein
MAWQPATWLEDKRFLLVGSVLGAALLLSALTLRIGLLEFKKLDNQALSVTGSVQQAIVSDSASWRLKVSRQAANLQEAYKAIKTDVQQIQTFLTQHGVPATQWTVQPVETTVLYTQLPNGSSTNVIEGYRLTQPVLVNSPDVDKLTQVVQGVSALIEQGVGVDSEAPQYFYTKLDDLKVEMLGKAMANAKDRAQHMATSTGAHIGVVRSAQMGVFQITPRNSTEVSDYGVNDTTSRDKTVTAVVNATFSIQ